MGHTNQNFYEKIHQLLKTKTSVPTIDAHNHLVNFLQQSEGIEELLKAMKASNINKSVIFGMPVMKKWANHQEPAPIYYLSDNSKCYYYSWV